MAKMKLALVQFQSVLGDVEASMARALPMIDEAAAAGANMVVFPELFTTGYHLDTVGPRMTELAEPIDGPTVRALQEAARKITCISWLLLPFYMGFRAFRTTARCSLTPTARCRGRLTRFICGPSSASISVRATIPSVRHRIRQSRHNGVLRHGFPRGRRVRWR